MSIQRITRDNLPTAVDETLRTCAEQMTTAQGPLATDLQVAIAALELIQRELSGDAPQRPKGLRSAQFARYALDEDDRLVIDEQLKKTIIKIEDVYQRL